MTRYAASRLQNRSEDDRDQGEKKEAGMSIWVATKERAADKSQPDMNRNSLDMLDGVSLAVSRTWLTPRELGYLVRQLSTVAVTRPRSNRMRLTWWCFPNPPIRRRLTLRYPLNPTVELRTAGSSQSDRRLRAVSTACSQNNPQYLAPDDATFKHIHRRLPTTSQARSGRPSLPLLTTRAQLSSAAQIQPSLYAQ